MKCAFVALLVAFNSIGALAQKNNFFADAGIALSRFLPGASITYDYNLVKPVGVGIGVQGYDFHATMTTFQMIPKNRMASNPMRYGEMASRVAARLLSRWSIQVSRL